MAGLRHIAVALPMSNQHQHLNGVDVASDQVTSSSPMATRRYTVLVEKGPRSYGATVPDLPGCVAVATSRREVLRLIAEAIPLHLAAMVAADETVPPLVHEAAIVEVEDSPPRRHQADRASAGPQFSRYIGVDYSGAETPTSSLKGLRVFVAEHGRATVQVGPPAGLKKYWTRRAIAEWLVSQLAEGPPTLIGIDHGFSFPEAYFKKHRLPRDWRAFLVDFHKHWPTDEDHMYVDFIRDGVRDRGNGAARTGARTWRRLTEVASGPAKSVFHFDVQGQVAKSTHAGLPWLKFILEHPALTSSGRVPHVWPFDGWTIPAGRSALVEVYPRLWKHLLTDSDPAWQPGMSDDERDACVIARALCEADIDGRLAEWFDPLLNDDTRTIAGHEGWILGVMP